MISQENNNTEISVTGSTAYGTKRPSEDARDLGPMRTGSFVIGRVGEIVGKGGVEVPAYVVTKYDVAEREGFSSHPINTGQFACTSTSSRSAVWFCHQDWQTQHAYFNANW
jgi:hypothetical protein